LEELSTLLTNAQNARRSQETRLSPKSKLALQSLGFELKQDIQVARHIIDVVKRKKRCFLCPSNPGRKIRQVCDVCQRNICKHHSTSTKKVICQLCEEAN
jgi:hypothetical protein